jgi:hypothetical protein
MVAVPSYRGPYERSNEAGDPILPIVPSIARWQKDNQNCSRKQFPLRLAYAISIHKSQGMTLNKAVLELGERDFCRGLSFVAISRVRTLVDLAFVRKIGKERLKNLGGQTHLAVDLHRRQTLPFQDAEGTLGYIFND